jgi:hypothetical protein
MLFFCTYFWQLHKKYMYLYWTSVFEIETLVDVWGIYKGIVQVYTLVLKFQFSVHCRFLILPLYQ